MADFEDLDYHITFPSPTLCQDDPVYDDNLLKPQINSPKEPVVILLGWAGCQEKHMKKYSSIYDKRCITIQYTAPTEDLFYKQHNLKKTAVKILELVKDLVEENPIIFHVFSNGGGMLYHRISELAMESPLYRDTHIVGCIFDSLPSERSLRVAARVFADTIKANFFIKYFILSMFLLFNFVFNMMQKIPVLNKIKSSASNADYWEYMFADRTKWPCLYLYSKGDDIVNHCYVDDVIRNRKSLGCDIQSVCWEDSPHVQHLRHHRDAYIVQCHQFLDYCIRKIEK